MHARNSERSYCVPYPNELDVWFVRVSITKHARAGRVRSCIAITIPIKLHRVADSIHMRDLQQTAVPKHPGQTSRGKRSSAKSKDPYFVSRFVITNEKFIGASNIARDPKSKHAAPDPFPVMRPNPFQITKQLRPPVTVCLVQRRCKLGNVRGQMFPALGLFNPVPSPIRADYQSLRHLISPPPLYEVNQIRRLLSRANSHAAAFDVVQWRSMTADDLPWWHACRVRRELQPTRLPLQMLD